MNRKKLTTAFMVVFLLLLAIPAYAMNEVKTFGFTDERHRDGNVNGTVLYPAWYHDGGASYSQPLILSGERWGMSDKTVFIAVLGNKLNGYILSDSSSSDPPKFKQISPVWSVNLSGNTPTKSHPTFVERDGKQYIYIGTYSKYFNILDVTDFNSVDQSKLVHIDISEATDITSAPLVLGWQDHEITVCTSGNTGKVFVLADPLTSNYTCVSINVGAGRTSSSPAPVPGGFAVGLDGGQNYGELRIYYFDDILDEQNGKVVQKSASARVAKQIPSGLVASFCVDGNMLYFGDCKSRVYAFNINTNSFIWGNQNDAGIFSNRSPALTSSRVYFPATGNAGDRGKVLAIDRSTGATAWAIPMTDPYKGTDLGRAQTAPIVLRAPGAAGVLEGTSRGYLAIIDPASGKIIYSFPVADKTGDSSYATGVSGEISAAGDYAVTTSESGMVIWQLINADLDLAVTSFDAGLPAGGKAQPSQEYIGTVVYENLAEKSKTAKPAVVKVTHNGYEAVLVDDAGNTVQELTLEPGEKKTFSFKWHGPTDSKTSVLKTTINLPPDVDLPEKTYDNNEKTLDIAVDFDNLWVEILDYTKEAEKGGTASVEARIHNDRGELVTTRLVWKVNGVVAKEINNYDLIGTLDDSITFTMASGDASVTVEVNPDHDRPANEVSFNDNKANCTVKLKQYAIPAPSDTSVLKIRIEAPSKVDAFKKWTYKVIVTTNYREPSTLEHTPPPKITMNANAEGQTADINIGYDLDSGYQKIDRVIKTENKEFSSGWDYQEHMYFVEYPATGIWGSPVTVQIKASANSSWGQSANTRATVTINPWPIPKRELQLYR